ncbi:MAG: hypothetical protein RH917_18060 [Lacipirellulaceae bacterium]
MSFLLESADASAQNIVFDTEIVSMDLTGTATLPLGQGGADMITGITLTRATDHNSSRSNKTSSNAVSPDDIDPDEEDGKTFPLFSSIDVEFSLSFIDNDPNVDFAQALGDTPIAETDSNAILELEQGATFVFDKMEPDFNMLKAAGPPKKRFRGHVTVLKIAFGGGGGDIDLAADGMAVELLPGTDNYKTLPNGDIEHAVGITIDLDGTYNGSPFQVTGLTGTLVERGQLANTLVPEPTSALLMALGSFALLGRGRR